MKSITLIAATALSLFLMAASANSATQQQGAAPAFSEVTAIFNKYHCTLCHGTAKASDGLAVDKHESLMKGSKHGAVVVPKDPAKSRLVKRIKGLSEPRMPMNGPPWLTEDEVQTIEKWIAAGALKE